MPVNGLLNTDITKMSHDEENALIAERRRKLHALRESGIAYPNDFRRDALAEELHQTHGAKDNDSLETEVIAVSVAGRMMAKRVMGKASFAKLQDRSGQIQLFVLRGLASRWRWRSSVVTQLGSLPTPRSIASSWH